MKGEKPSGNDTTPILATDDVFGSARHRSHEIRRASPASNGHHTILIALGRIIADIAAARLAREQSRIGTATEDAVSNDIDGGCAHD